MPTLHVRNVPSELYERLKRMAKEQNRSLSAQVIVLLKQAVEREARPQAEVIASIRRRRRFQPAAAGAPDSLELLRQDRRR